MVALNLIELFSIIFFLLFIIILLIAVFRRCTSTVSKKKPEKGDKRKSSSNGSNRSGQHITIPIPIQARIHHLSTSSTTSLPTNLPPTQNIRTIYLGNPTQVGNSGRSVYTIPVSARDLRRTSVVVVLDRRTLSQGEERPNTIQEISPPPSYDDCIPPPQYSDVFP